uniref:Uncharacterized protein n=1 Tax=uncultured marine virus TaxID=186617 RepID=A0A0F7L5A3_9VIRU|nr:hypothetical protein [uncultured marine virus]
MALELVDGRGGIHRRRRFDGLVRSGVVRHRYLLQKFIAQSVDGRRRGAVRSERYKR